MLEFSFEEANGLPSVDARNLSPSYMSQDSSSKTASQGPNGQKEKRQPSITPRKFRRFFTPRSLPQSSSRRALVDITTPVNNRNGIQSSPLQASNNSATRETSPTVFTRDMKKRKLLHTPSPPHEGLSLETSPLLEQSRESEDSNLEEFDYVSSSPCIKAIEGHLRGLHYRPSVNERPRPVMHLDSRGLAGQLLQLNVGFESRFNHHSTARPVSGKLIPIP